MSHRQFIEQYLSENASEDEIASFRKAFALMSPSEQQSLMEDFELVRAGRVDFGPVNEQLLDDIQIRIANWDSESLQHTRRVRLIQRTWFRAAAAVLLFAGIGTYLWLTPAHKNPEISQSNSVPEKNEVLPGGSRAVLTLADGSLIILDSAKNGLLAKEPGANVEKTADGKIIYASGKGPAMESVSYNTMNTPRGGQYELVLPDGSKVWLNASSITFPTTFTSDTREVSITGEAYFEIAKNKSKPFIVMARQEKIQVLGTSFNVNAYEDEPYVRTSLLEGSVKINQLVLKPGEAASNNKMTTTNIEQDISWKNGYFNFNNVELKAALRQLARWYNIDVAYEGSGTPVEFQGELPRTLTLSQVLKVLSKVDVKFRLEGMKLIVTP